MADLTAVMLKSLAGPSIEEVGAILGDNVRVYRLKDLLRTARKTERILKDAGLKVKAVPSRLLLPILDTCSVEDAVRIFMERWAGLLATASERIRGLAISILHRNLVKQLTPNESPSP